MWSRARISTAAALFGALCIALSGAAMMSREAAIAAERDGAIAAEAEQSKTADGLTVYLGLLPAEIIKGPPKHVDLSKGPHDYQLSSKSPHEYQIVAAIFDAKSSERISDAVVTAEVSGLGLSGGKQRLELTQIAGATTYGGFVELPASDIYSLKLAIERTGLSAVDLQFRFDHRR